MLSLNIMDGMKSSLATLGMFTVLVRGYAASNPVIRLTLSVSHFYIPFAWAFTDYTSIHCRSSLGPGTWLCLDSSIRTKIT